jgi:uncharacterized protein YjbI with pentapeptide repeats
MRKKILDMFKDWMKIILKHLKKLFVVLVIIAAILLLWQTPGYILRELPDESKGLFEAQNELRKTLIQIIGCSAILYGLYLVARRIKGIDDTSRSQFEALKITEERQITDRFTKAIEQLANDRVEIRLGGIYALERIAHYFAQGHWMVMEVLTTFVREKSREEKKVKKEQHTSGINSEEEKYSRSERMVRTDVQAILTVIGRRKWRDTEPGRINLKNSYLRGANLEEAQLGRANLEEVDLGGANLNKADLKEANLFNANLDGALLGKTNLREANLSRANLGGANLSGAILSGTTLSKAYLAKAILVGADLQGANLSGVDLFRADLGKASLSKAHLHETNLQEADLGGAKYLTLEQLSRVKTLYGTRLDSTLLEQVKVNYPHLLEEPK